jgi:hypothetical protein
MALTGFRLKAAAIEEPQPIDDFDLSCTNERGYRFTFGERLTRAQTKSLPFGSNLFKRNEFFYRVNALPSRSFTVMDRILLEKPLHAADS